MKRIALLSDIHANDMALTAVLTDLNARGGADNCWCLGDVVGYNDAPWTCLQDLHDLGNSEPWLIGNHDRAVAVLMGNPIHGETLARSLVGNYNGDAFWAIRRHAEELAEVSHLLAYQRLNAGVTWLSPRPGIVIAHGTVCAPAEADDNILGSASYCNNYQRAESAFTYLRGTAQIDCHLLCVGHTHLAQAMWRSAADRPRWDSWQGRVPGATDQPGELTVELPSPGRGWTVVSPGSIGQPRGFRGSPDPRAAYALLTLAEDHTTVQFRRVPYPISAVQKRMRDKGYPEWNYERLSSGQ